MNKFSLNRAIPWMALVCWCTLLANDRSLLAGAHTPQPSSDTKVPILRDRPTTGETKSGSTPLGILRQVSIEILPTGSSNIISQKDLDRLFADRYNESINDESIQQIVEQLNQLYKERGYELAQVVNVKSFGEGRLLLVVAEGAIEDVQVRFFTKDLTTGQDRYVNDQNQPLSGLTRPFIITREMETKTGGVFNRRTIERDARRVYGLGHFQDLKLNFLPGRVDPSKVIVFFDVQETGKTSSVNGGGTYSSSGLGGFGSYQQLNLGGNNQTFGGQVSIGNRGTTFDLKFTDPWIGGDPHRTGYDVSLFQSRSTTNIFDGGRQPVYLSTNRDVPTILRTGGGITFARPLSGNPYEDRGWRSSLGVEYQKVTVQNPAGQTTATDAAGKTLSFSGSGQDDLLMVQLGLGKDSRNNFSDPSSGDVLRLGIDQSIPVGNANIGMTRLRGSYTTYVPVQLVNFVGGASPTENRGAQALVFNVQGGTILGDLPPYEAFSLGGVRSVRGYEEGDVGTGRSYLQATAEYRFPLFSIIGGSLFADYGSDLGTGRSVPGDPAGTRLKPGNGFGYGAGVRLNTGILGSLRLDYGRNNLGEERIQFGFGDRF
jgi:outer membrane protein insertion porin family